MADPYLLPNRMLKNKLGLTEAEALQEAETEPDQLPTDEDRRGRSGGTVHYP